MTLKVTEKFLNLIFSWVEEPQDLQPSSPGPLLYLTPCFPPLTQVFLSLPLSFSCSCCVDKSVSAVLCDQRRGGCWGGVGVRGLRRIGLRSTHSLLLAGGVLRANALSGPSLALCLWQPSSLHNLTSNWLMTFLWLYWTTFWDGSRQNPWELRRPVTWSLRKATCQL